MRYRVLASRRSRCLLEVELVTGLSHQIRAQLAAVGQPIMGDRKYGSRARLAQGKIALRAVSLSIRHPVRATELSIAADPPPHWPW
jgi:23S rRNA pseudouridine1911/1915/1917 synthase